MPVRLAATCAVAALGLATSTAAVLAPSAADAAYTPQPARPTVIAGGSGMTLALTTGGTVRAWGSGGAGQLGNGTYAQPSTPVTVVGYSGSAPLDHVVEVSAAGDTGYALRSDGTVAAWGGNNLGQLGNGVSGSLTDRPAPVLSTTGSGPLTNVVAISAGSTHVLALRSNGTVVAWGGGADGELGNGASTSSSIPVVVHGPSGGFLTGIVAISAGYLNSYALTSTGHVYAWGYGGQGALGANDTTPSAVPVPVHGVGDSGDLSNVVAISGGVFAALALLSNGTVVSWGFGDQGNQGNGSTTTNMVPAPVPALGDHIASISAGSYSYHSAAIGASGSVYVWGQNNRGELCTGAVDSSPVLTPENAGALTSLGLTQIGNGYYNSAAVDSHGAVVNCGDNSVHELGDGSTINATTPVHPYGLPTIGTPKLFLRVAPVLGGHAQINYTLTVTTGTWDLPATSIAYQWLRDGRSISGATHSTYKATAEDKGHHVSVRVSAARYGYPGNSIVTRSVAITH